MVQPRRSDERVVYSTAGGKICPQCQQPVSACRCSKKPAGPRGDGNVRVRRESKGRRGKVMTVIVGLALEEAALAELAAKLKKKLGTGGAVKDGAIEIQGDHRDTLVTMLREMGHSAKPAGG